MRVSILLYEGVDLLDSGGPYEVFLTANRLALRDGDPAPFDIETVTTDGQAVTAYGGLGLVPSASGTSLTDTDLLIVPGAIDPSIPCRDEKLLALIASVNERATSTIASVCTGAFLLARVGLLDDKDWTTHWEDIDDLTEQIGSSGAIRGKRWVDAGAVVTSGAISSGIAMALHLVERFADLTLATRTANQIEYEWTETPSQT